MEPEGRGPQGRELRTYSGGGPKRKAREPEGTEARRSGGPKGGGQKGGASQPRQGGSPPGEGPEGGRPEGGGSFDRTRRCLSMFYQL